MKILIITSSFRGIASLCIPVLCNSNKISSITVIHTKYVSKKKKINKVIKKVFSIGLLGSLNGIRLRKWYYDKTILDFRNYIKKYNIEYHSVECINSDQTIRIIKKAKPDLGLALGTGYISKNIFTIPEKGFLNVHTEILPRFQGAQSIIWPIYEGIKKCGFTIHEIDNKIDNGRIFYLKEYDIKFYSNLKKTVIKNLHYVRRQIPEGVLKVCENFEYYNQNAKSQTRMKYYTTPSILQFIKIKINHCKLKHN